MPTALRWLILLLPANPICVRLVQGGSRRQRHNIIRMTFLFVVMVALLILIFPAAGQMGYKQLALRAATAFELVAYLQIALICILAPIFMAGAIAQESNPRTWEILLTTPLSPLQLVLGQLFGRLFFILALLVSTLPFFALTQYFGGVPGRSIFASYAIAAGASLLVGAIAITVAVNRIGGRRIVFIYVVSMVTYVAITAAIDSALRANAPGVTALTPLNPFLALSALLDPITFARPDPATLGAMNPLSRLWFGSPVLSWVLVSFLSSIALIIANTLTVRRIGLTGGSNRLLTRKKSERHRAPRKVWHNPIAWREAAARQNTIPRIIARWSFVVIGSLWGLGILAAFHGGGLSQSDYRFILLATLWTEVVLIVLVALNVSATAISREREDGTLDLLLTTPITPADYLSGKLRGLISYLTPMLAIPVGTLAAACIYVLIVLNTNPSAVLVTEYIPGSANQATAPLVLPEAAILFPIALLPFTAFAVMIGLYWSLRSKGTISSVIATTGVVITITGILGLCGWQAAQSVPIVGPLLAALNPIVLAFTFIEPIQSMPEPISLNSGLTTSRITLGAGALVSAFLYLLVIHLTRKYMTSTFDMTVRKLAGTN